MKYTEEYTEEEIREHIKNIQNEEETNNEFLLFLKREITKIIRFNGYSIVGYDEEDLIQNCWIKSWEFVKVFKLHLNAKFISTLKIVIDNHIKDLFKTANYQKRKILVYTFPINDLICVPQSKNNDYNRMILNDIIKDLFKRFKNKKLEIEAFLLVRSGYSYKEVAAKLFDGNVKKIDNIVRKFNKTIRSEYRNDMSGFVHDESRSGNRTRAKVICNDGYEDFDPDGGSYQQVAKKIMDE
jgi:DNA-directed RNA polymerase specialized sigma24 family protein